MEPGEIVEYIDRQKILAAVVVEAKGGRLRLLNEGNREVKLTENRVLFTPSATLPSGLSRDGQVEALKETAARRAALTDTLDIEELWEVIHPEAEWVDLETITELAFSTEITDDHRAAVVRGMFSNRTYFKFQNHRFFPYTPEQVDRIQAQEREAERRQRIIEAGGDWIKRVLNGGSPPAPSELTEAQAEVIEILKSTYLIEKESPHFDMARAMVERAGAEMGDGLFEILVRLGVWGPDENIDIYRLEVPTRFSDIVIERSDALVAKPGMPVGDTRRRDLTHLDLITIDGQATLDYDDALSLEELADGFRVGVHIADVGHFIRRDDPIDREAMTRASSIYMPDRKIPMLPPSLAEDLCSLRAGEPRPAISTLIRVTPAGEVRDAEIVPSLIRVNRQWSYFDVNQVADDHPEIARLHAIARKFRERRLSDGAVQITLPELNIWMTDEGELNVVRTNRESPGRLLVSELMIMANWFMARFLTDHGLPAIFRSQPAPKERLFRDGEGSLFQNWMQRKLLSRFVLSHGPERHSGLGLDAYLTGTSPIRKYSDLITQRQIRSVFGLEQPYTAEEIDAAITALQGHISAVSRLQNRRKRYWLLKYLEGKVGRREEAIVLTRRKTGYTALVPEYLIECPVPVPSGVTLKPEDLVRVTIQHVNARKDVLSVFMT